MTYFKKDEISFYSINGKDERSRKHIGVIESMNNCNFEYHTVDQDKLLVKLCDTLEIINNWALDYSGNVNESTFNIVLEILGLNIEEFNKLQQMMQDINCNRIVYFENKFFLLKFEAFNDFESFYMLTSNAIDSLDDVQKIDSLVYMGVYFYHNIKWR